MMMFNEINFFFQAVILACYYLKYKKIIFFKNKQINRSNKKKIQQLKF